MSGDINEVKRFSLGEAYVKIRKDGMYDFKNDKDHKLENAVINIFRAIAKSGFQDYRIKDKSEEQLLNKFESIFKEFTKDGTLDDTELAWLQNENLNDIESYIQVQYNKIENAKREKEEAEKAEAVKLKV